MHCLEAVKIVGIVLLLGPIMFGAMMLLVNLVSGGSGVAIFDRSAGFAAGYSMFLGFVMLAYVSYKWFMAGAKGQ